jgi:hypothetical protein
MTNLVCQYSAQHLWEISRQLVAASDLFSPVIGRDSRYPMSEDIGACIGPRDSPEDVVAYCLFGDEIFAPCAVNQDDREVECLTPRFGGLSACVHPHDDDTRTVVDTDGFPLGGRHVGR